MKLLLEKKKKRICRFKVVLGVVCDNWLLEGLVGGDWNGGKGSTGDGFGSGEWNREYGIMIKSWEVKNWFHYSLLGQGQMLLDYIAQAKCFLTCSGVCYKERTSSKLAGFLSESSLSIWNLGFTILSLYLLESTWLFTLA